MKIKTHWGMPILDVSDGVSAGETTDFGLIRDRQPDNGWGELQRVNIRSPTIKETELTNELKMILLEDLAYAFGQDSKKFTDKLKDFKII